MPRGKSLDEVLADAEKLDRVWDANPSLTLGDLTREKFKAELNALRESRAQLEEARRQVTNLSNTTNERAVVLVSYNTRVLSGIRAVFGPDSTQYEEGGGTRSSERKTPKPKKGGGTT
ncbi:MAG TPA: hypothetical protein VF297_05915 [Pyrinomonadaceae bacterium]